MKKYELFQIGDIAKMFHLSVSSLRHYEKIGLVEPEYIDQKTGYRYYSTRQFECLNTIRALEQGQPDAVVFLGKVGVGISMNRLTAGKYDKYDMVFLVLDLEDQYTGTTEDLPEETCATVCFCGSHKDAPEYYRRLQHFIAEHGLQPLSAQNRLRPLCGTF